MAGMRGAAQPEPAGIARHATLHAAVVVQLGGAMDNAPASSGITREQRQQVLDRITHARGFPVVHRDSDEVAAFAMTPREPLADAALEWSVLDRAVHAMEARDWPAAIVPITRDSLAAPSFAYRVRDLAERHGVDPRRIWLELDSPDAVLALPGVVGVLSVRHRVGCRIDGAHAMEERIHVPDLAEAGITFAWIAPGSARSLADDLSMLIGGRSLVRRAHTHGIQVIGPSALDADMTPPLGP